MMINHLTSIFALLTMVYMTSVYMHRSSDKCIRHAKKRVTSSPGLKLNITPFDRIAMFEVPLRRASGRGSYALCRRVRYSYICAASMSPALKVAGTCL